VPNFTESLNPQLLMAYFQRLPFLNKNI
jgi:hypothetical protein